MSTSQTMFIKQHLTEKEPGAAYETWQVSALIADNKDQPEPRVMVLSPLCLYLFHIGPFKKSVFEASLLQLESIDVKTADAVASMFPLCWCILSICGFFTTVCVCAFEFMQSIPT
jgi:hypothetical protein